MVRDQPMDVRLDFLARNIVPVTERHFANVLVERMRCGIRIMIGLVSPDCRFIPFTGKNAASASQFESAPDAADSRKKIDEIEIRLCVVRRSRR